MRAYFQVDELTWLRRVSFVMLIITLFWAKKDSSIGLQSLWPVFLFSYFVTFYVDCKRGVISPLRTLGWIRLFVLAGTARVLGDIILRWQRPIDPREADDIRPKVCLLCGLGKAFIFSPALFVDVCWLFIWGLGQFLSSMSNFVLGDNYLPDTWQHMSMLLPLLWWQHVLFYCGGFFAWILLWLLGVPWPTSALKPGENRVWQWWTYSYPATKNDAQWEWFRPFWLIGLVIIGYPVVWMYQITNHDWLSSGIVGLIVTMLIVLPAYGSLRIDKPVTPGEHVICITNPSLVGLVPMFFRDIGKTTKITDETPSILIFFKVLLGLLGFAPGLMLLIGLPTLAYKPDYLSVLAPYFWVWFYLWLVMVFFYWLLVFRNTVYVRTDKRMHQGWPSIKGLYITSIWSSVKLEKIQLTSYDRMQLFPWVIARFDTGTTEFRPDNVSMSYIPDKFFEEVPSLWVRFKTLFSNGRRNV